MEIDVFVLSLNQDINPLCNICMHKCITDLCSCVLIYMCLHRKHLTIYDTKMVVNKIPQLQENSRENHVELCIWIHNHKSMVSVEINLIRSFGQVLPLQD